jgi:hypothetical protein
MKSHARILWSLFSALLMAIPATAETNEQESGQGYTKENLLQTQHPEGKRVKVDNAYCPISGGPLDSNAILESRTREYKGQKIGFCCDNCPKKWDKMTEQEKDKNLKEALSSASP